VVQKYIERPLTFYKRKFDLRIWVVVNAQQEIYFYKEGYLRTSSDAYDLDNKNNYVHLTNNCLQKNGNNYGKFEDGNTLSYAVLQQYLDDEGYSVSVEDHIVPRMKDIVIDSILSVAHELNPNGRENMFELFGFDFMIDEDFRTWLIEINTNPYLGIPNVFIEQLLPRMLNDMVVLTVDPIFPPKIP
jgi:hypothetical protein